MWLMVGSSYALFFFFFTREAGVDWSVRRVSHAGVNSLPAHSDLLHELRQSILSPPLGVPERTTVPTRKAESSRVNIS